MVNGKKILLGILGLSLLVGCGSKETKEVEPAKEKKDKETLIYGIWSSPTGVFNPLISDTIYDTAVNTLVYDSLLKLDKEYNLEPSMAEDYKLSDDMLSLSFTLQDDLRFHDGEKLTTKDVEYTLTSVADAKYTGSEYSTVEFIKGAKAYHEDKADKIEGITIKDDKTIDITFEKPFASALQKIGTLSILPKHIWEKTPVEKWEKETKVLHEPIGSGPYQVKEFKNGEFVKMIAFADYHTEAPKIKNFNFKVVNQDTAIGEITKGDIDVADISSFKQKDLDFLEKNKIKVVDYPGPNIQYMGMNLRNDQLKNKDVRQAIAYGVDRQGIVNELLDGHGELIQTPMVPTLWSYPDKGLTEYKKDDKKAKELLKKAGYTQKDDKGIFEKDGKKLSFTLTVPTGDKMRESTAPIIQSQLKEIGIDIKLENQEFSSVMDKVVGNHDFDLYLMANTLSSDPDLKPFWHSSAASDEPGVYAWNISSFKDEKTDKLLEKALEVTEQEERKEIYQEVGQTLNKDLPWLPLYTPNIIKAYTPSLQNYKPATFLDFYEVEKWSFK
ncbi:ABC transporter substrate-binding protein [Vagococcus carniphilus]|uniref:ABC transporter substrate-binding protein n=1 Tax=Vagococcus carniphilus TaxID=218144 RepID=UPI003B5BEBBA